MIWLAVGVGGAIGSVARHAVNVATHKLAGESVPYATAAVNVIGCLIIGLIAGAVASGWLRLGAQARVFVFVGVLGGFTTFSSFGLDTFTLVRGGAFGVAIANVAGQVVIGLACVWIGYAIASRWGA